MSSKLNHMCLQGISLIYHSTNHKLLTAAVSSVLVNSNDYLFQLSHTARSIAFQFGMASVNVEARFDDALLGIRTSAAPGVPGPTRELVSSLADIVL